MKQSLPAFRTTAFSLFGVFLLLLLLTNSDLAMDGARRGISLCLETLFPSLFPFLVFSELLVAIGAGEVLGHYIGRPVKALFGVSGSGAVAFLLGSVCGFPVGTTTAVSCLEREELTKGELQRLVLFCNNPSSGFLIAAVGGGLFGSKQLGAALFCITLCSSVILGILLRLLCGKAEQIPNKCRNGAKNALGVTTFTGAIRRALFSMLSVCAFVIFFSCIAACVSRILTALSAPAWLGVLLHGALELTSGISAACVALPRAAAFRAAAFFASFSGLSVCLQVFACAEGKGLHPEPYLLAKTAQGGIALLLAEGYLRLCSPALTPTQSVESIATVTRSPLLLVFLVYLVFLAVWHVLTRKKAPERVP